MALHWQWADKCGEATFKFNDGEECTVNLYEGNAFLIFVNEFVDKDTGKNMYNVYSFFVDENHAKRMLGLEKGETNAFNDSYHALTKVRLNKAKHSKPQKLIQMLVKAFDNITIEIYNEK